ncbi:MAG: sarcosine oxidase subunit delta [Woeseia sp.]
MIYINCPHCGERNESEFVYGGNADRPRPADPDELSDAAWCDYIYTVPNIKGWAREFWWHVHGCNRWITLLRDSRTDEVQAVTQEADRG